jgi:dienelactone hydrolase
MKSHSTLATVSVGLRIGLAAVSSGCGGGGGEAGSADAVDAAGSSPFAIDGGRQSESDASSSTVEDAGGDDSTETDGGTTSAPDAHANPATTGPASDASGPSVEGGTTTTAPTPSKLPVPTGSCPTIADSHGTSTVLQFAGQAITIWAGAKAAKPGPIVYYWYSTGGAPSQATTVLTQAGISKITAMGGIVAAPNQSTKQGDNTTDAIWYSADLPIADEVIACAIQQGYGDPRHIHVLGYSAGAMQTVYMWAARSNYVASVISYSGGDIGAYSGGQVGKNNAPLQDPTNAPPAIVAHGKDGTGGDIDYLNIDIYKTSLTWEHEIRVAGGFAIDCGDQSSHVDIATRTAIAPEALQFFLDHPYKVAPEPYASGLPSGWPTYCSIVK